MRVGTAKPGTGRCDIGGINGVISHITRKPRALVAGTIRGGGALGLHDSIMGKPGPADPAGQEIKIFFP
jgi:hypothetical protein